MKKFILTALTLMTVICVNAANYTVTVSTQERIEWIDQRTQKTVAYETQIGKILKFDVVANSPREAEDIALDRCQGTCRSGSAQLVQTSVLKDGKLCDKYVTTVPYSANAELNFKQ